MNINPSILSELATSFTKEEIENQNRILGATSDNNQEIIEEEKKEKIMEKYNSEFKERLLMEYNDIINKIDRLSFYLNEVKELSNDDNMRSYIEICQRQTEFMMQYKGCLETRILMIMDGVVK